ncbi:nucleolar RNA helicase 2-A [Xenopus laevis]|uniref:Nucleolar RNA helicase 2-A n=1 Tax=Xenopus laevis TaxID=8355 RepID=DD21A_XENLA|nr:nucleolar RNA helicase 2-A [Xenopus laevis]Q9DF35.2 RecName: Full=Nucleolar RNA helicase 2-A; AltName: Full=DEAD box protein 21-A; AltName: Full=Gu-alpha-A; AltName: Full=Nucleolar RNA helicase Gu-A; Short=xGu-1; AltName: Full=Nucleolar RNA helicase II-A; AltName: Full=RH II/Gu-A [Xenopus laevis]AAG22819.2 RNA helicase II/Gu [Xenopus laevis]
MPVKVYAEEMEGESMKKKKLSETPLPKIKKRKMKNGDTEDLDLEHMAESVNGEINNNNPTPKLKKKKKPAPISDLSETAEECDGEQPDPSTPTPKKVKKKKIKESKEDSDTQEEAEQSEPQTNGVKSVKKSKKNITSDDNEPAPKKRKTDTTEITTAKECEEKVLTKEEQDINQEKIDGDFSKFPLSKETIKNLQAKGVSYLFPIQSKTFHTAYSGKDVVVQARTGTGKTFSFAIPLVEKLNEDQQPLARGRAPRVIILTPTRELAIQITNEIRSITKKLKVSCFYGGTPYQQQVFAIKDGIDFLVGTPGRVRDLVQNYRLDLTTLKHVVLDEVDMMFDMGFSEQVEEILSVRYKADPEENPQTLLFSATCPDWMYNMAKKYMRKQFEKIDLIGHRSQKAATTVEHLAIECTRSQKAAVLGDLVQVYSGSHGKTIIFCDSKLEAHTLATSCGSLKQSAKSLHGDLQQKEREVVLKGFRQGTFEVLIATNVAARGLDIPEVDLVVLYSAPKEADAYVHRSGRTGRAGRTGVCISLYEPWERHYLRNVERSTGITFKRVGVPSLLNVAKSSSADAIKSLDTVPADVIEHFKEYAQELIEQKGALTAIAAALAHISGATSIKQRSLLNMEAGCDTITLKSSVPIHSLSYAWQSIKEQLGDDVDSKIHRMCLLKDSMGVCFDVRSENLESMQERWTDTKQWQFTVATELPAIQESERNFDGPRNRGFGGRGRRPFDRRNNSRNSNRGGGGRGRNRNGGFRRGR